MKQAQPQTYGKFADTVSQLISDNNMQQKSAGQQLNSELLAAGRLSRESL